MSGIKINTSLARKLILVSGLILAIGLISGCAGTVKTFDKDTGKKISSVPAGVAVMQEAKGLVEACPKPANYVMSVNEITKLSASAQAEAVRNIPMLTLLGIMQAQNNGGACYTAVVRATQEFFRTQATKYRQWGMVGRTGVISAATYFSVEAVTKGLFLGRGAGDTQIGELNITGSSSGGGEAGGPGGRIDQKINIGNGTQNTAGENINFGEKPINGNENVFEDSDSPNTNTSIF